MVCSQHFRISPNISCAEWSNCFYQRMVSVIFRFNAYNMRKIIYGISYATYHLRHISRDRYKAFGKSKKSEMISKIIWIIILFNSNLTMYCQNIKPSISSISDFSLQTLVYFIIDPISTRTTVQLVLLYAKAPKLGYSISIQGAATLRITRLWSFAITWIHPLVSIRRFLFRSFLWFQHHLILLMNFLHLRKIYLKLLYGLILKESMRLIFGAVQGRPT